MASSGEKHSPLDQFEINPLVNFEVGGVDLAFTNSSVSMVITVLFITLFLTLTVNPRSIVPSRMQLISELEPDKRGPYSGGVGYFSFNGNMDTCIAIRTMVLKDKTVYLQAGGGIVADSKVDYEYEETLNKMMALIKSVDDAERNLK